MVDSPSLGLIVIQKGMANTLPSPIALNVLRYIATPDDGAEKVEQDGDQEAYRQAP